MNPRDELLIWIQKNKRILRGRGADEVMQLAMMDGHDVVEVHRILSHWHADTGLEIEFREIMAYKKDLTSIEKAARRFKLWLYQKEFDE